MAATTLVEGLAARGGRAVDLLYSALVHQLGLTQRFFPRGFGELSVIDFHADVEAFRAWPPPQFESAQVRERASGGGWVVAR